MHLKADRNRTLMTHSALQQHRFDNMTCPSSLKRSTTMAREHYIIRVGNQRFAQSSSPQVTNHWHYLSPQHLWGFPKTMTTVKVRARFLADIAAPDTTAYIWFLCNSHGGQPGRFVQLAIGVRDQAGDHPRANTNLHPHAPARSSFPAFEALIHDVEQHSGVASVPSPVTEAEAVELDLRNLRREHGAPHAEGYVYLIHMADTAFYKIGMSLDPGMRLRTLQTGNPHRLSIVRVSAVGDMRAAESGLHGRFERWRVRDVDAREWFQFTDGGGVGEVEGAFGEVGERTGGVE
ncbi:hypothetical protein G7Y79_00047g083090 [Physcia stellaris]|nr:hypothetical protein G7Y79_00047g083090 [Physcia stellaris]